MIEFIPTLNSVSLHENLISISVEIDKLYFVAISSDDHSKIIHVI